MSHHYAPERCPHCGTAVSRRSPLTARQAELMHFLDRQIRVDGFAPSLGEIARRFKYASLATVHEHLTNLERKGWIRRRYNESRAIEIVADVAARPDGDGHAEPSILADDSIPPYGVPINKKHVRQRRLLTVCRRGHALEGNNLYVSPKGSRQCRACWRITRAVAAQRSA